MSSTSFQIKLKKVMSFKLNLWIVIIIKLLKYDDVVKNNVKKVSVTK